MYQYLTGMSFFVQLLPLVSIVFRGASFATITVGLKLGCENVSLLCQKVIVPSILYFFILLRSSAKQSFSFCFVLLHITGSNPATASGFSTSSIYIFSWRFRCRLIVFLGLPVFDYSFLFRINLAVGSRIGRR